MIMDESCKYDMGKDRKVNQRRENDHPHQWHNRNTI